jgi:hypothetical protein
MRKPVLPLPESFIVHATALLTEIHRQQIPIASGSADPYLRLRKQKKGNEILEDVRTLFENIQIAGIARGDFRVRRGRAIHV